MTTRSESNYYEYDNNNNNYSIKKELLIFQYINSFFVQPKLYEFCQTSMSNRDRCKQGEWIAVLYGRKASVARVVAITSKDKATVHFLKGKKMSKKDVQNVVDTFCTCKVNVRHDIDRDEIVVTEQSTETFLFLLLIKPNNYQSCLLF